MRAPWWDFEVAYLMANQARLQTLAADASGPHRYRSARPRFVLRNEVSSISLLGFLDGEVVRSLDHVPSAVRDYVAQAFGAGPSHWLADCWA